MATRKPISTRSRFEVFKRDKFTCQYCGAKPPEVKLHVDHIIPVSRGGKNAKENFATSCSDCNLGKSNIPLSVAPASISQILQEVSFAALDIRAHIQAHHEKEVADCEALIEVANQLFPRGWDVLENAQSKAIEKAVQRVGLKTSLQLAVNVSRNPAIHDPVMYFAAVCRNIDKKNRDNNAPHIRH